MFLHFIFCFYQPAARNAPGWSYSYFAIFVSACLSACLSVCPSVQGLGRHGNELMARASTYMYGCFELAGLFASSLQKEANDVSTINSRGTPPITPTQYRKSSPRSTGMARNRQLTTNKPGSGITLLLQFCVLYVSSAYVFSW